MIYLLRHAHAGSKQTWSGPDDRRPLSATGRREADGLVRQLRAYPITTIVSSPTLRCLQTIQPLADQRCLPVNPGPASARGCRRRPGGHAAVSPRPEQAHYLLVVKANQPTLLDRCARLADLLRGH